MSTFDFRQFQSCVSRVAPACSLDDTRPVLQTVHIRTTRALTRFEAADGFRAYFMDAPAPLDGSKFDVMLAPATVKAVLKAKVMRNASPMIDVTPAGLVLDGKNIGGYCEEGYYPEINAVVPVHCPTFFHVFPAPFLSGVRPAYVFAKNGSGVIRLHITDSLLVEGKSKDIGASVTEVSIRMKHGPDLLIAFNGKFLIEFLKACPAGEAVKFECNKPTSPAVLTCKDGLKAVLMPMNFSNAPIQRAADLVERETTGTSYVWPASIPTPGPEWSMARYTPATTTDSWDFANYTQPEPGAVEYDLTGAAFDIEHYVPKYGKPIDTPRLALIVGAPRPDPLAPIEVSIPTPAYVRPVFENLCEARSNA